MDIPEAIIQEICKQIENMPSIDIRLMFPNHIEIHSTPDVFWVRGYVWCGWVNDDLIHLRMTSVYKVYYNKLFDPSDPGNDPKTYITQVVAELHKWISQKQ